MYQGFKQLAARFVKDEEGATAIEYSIIAGLMAAGLVGIFGGTGTFMSGLGAVFTKILGYLPH
jgi:pilus assembly protein Flp/PilA